MRKIKYKSYKEYEKIFKRAEKESIGKKCDTCGKVIKEPWIALCPSLFGFPNPRYWWIGEYCSCECGGSHFTP